MANNFRNQTPVRTFTKTYKRYRSYKIYLAKDFNYRCGYTDCPDFWFGGKNTFHIDHFKPFSKNPTLETDYSNLVYACRACNNSKRAHWPTGADAVGWRSAAPEARWSSRRGGAEEDCTQSQCCG